MKLIPLLALALLLPAFLRAEEPPTLAAVKAADEARIAAMLQADRTALEAAYSDDLRYTHSSGAIETKSVFVENLASGNFKYLAYDHVERDFTFPAPGIALMNGKAKLRVSSAKGDMNLYLSYLGVWREEDGKWRFLAWQSCRLPTEEPKP